MSMIVQPKPTAFRVTYLRVSFGGEPAGDQKASVVLAETFGQAAACFESVHGELFRIISVEPVVVIDLDARAAK